MPHPPDCDALVVDFKHVARLGAGVAVRVCVCVCVCVCERDVAVSVHPTSGLPITCTFLHTPVCVVSSTGVSGFKGHISELHLVMALQVNGT